VCDVQDTVVALHALAEFASLTVGPADDSIGLQLTAVYGDESHRFEPITRRNALLLQTVCSSLFWPVSMLVSMWAQNH